MFVKYTIGLPMCLNKAILQTFGWWQRHMVYKMHMQYCVIRLISIVDGPGSNYFLVCHSAEALDIRCRATPVAERRSRFFRRLRIWARPPPALPNKNNNRHTLINTYNYNTINNITNNTHTITTNSKQQNCRPRPHRRAPPGGSLGGSGLRRTMAA